MPERQLWSASVTSTVLQVHATSDRFVVSTSELEHGPSPIARQAYSALADGSSGITSETSESALAPHAHTLLRAEGHVEPRSLTIATGRMSTPATVWAAALALTYALPVHFAPTYGQQDSGATVRSKCLVSLLATMTCIASTHWALGLGDDWRWLGCDVTTLGVLLPTAVFLALFLGPLTQLVLDCKRGLPTMHWQTNTAVATRALLLAPLTEELTFRCCIGAILMKGGYSTSFLLRFSPLFFGAAHLPQIASLIRSGTPWQHALAGKAVQLTYTSIFGSLAMFVFLRTGTAVAPILLHAACNCVGCPDVRALASHPQRLQLRAAYALGTASFTALVWFYRTPMLHPLLVHP
jgi:prenyl protein peptidase